MKSPDEGWLTLYKRWTLRPGVTDRDVHRVVVQYIRPAYEGLSSEVELGFEVDRDGRSILAIQRWRTVEAHDRATTGPDYINWWRDYEPTLAAWDGLVEFAAEWSTIVVDVRWG